MNPKVIKNRIPKILAYSATTLVFLLISAFLILQIPAIQKKLVDRYLRGFSGVTGFRVSVDDFELLWFDRLELRNLRVLDLENNQMIAVKNMRVNFEISQLLEHAD